MAIEHDLDELSTHEGTFSILGLQRYGMSLFTSYLPNENGGGGEARPPNGEEHRNPAGTLKYCADLHPLPKLPLPLLPSALRKILRRWLPR